MQARVVASTKPGYVLPVDEALIFAGQMAGICYMPENYDAILAEPVERTMRRVDRTVGSGHHSVSDHVSYTLVLEGVPKIVAMILNNEHFYTTSEKSGRYTVMEPKKDPEKPNGEYWEKYEKEEVDENDSNLDQYGLAYYKKWVDIFEKKIRKYYPALEPAKARKLALENARYFISVFAPTITMAHTITLRNLNYLSRWVRYQAGFVRSDPFWSALHPYLKDLADCLEQIAPVPNMEDCKNRGLSLFAERQRPEEFGESYSVNYKGTFTQLAQAHRHRPLYYEMKIPDYATAEFYVPPIIRGDPELVAEYLADMKAVSKCFPQGMLVEINERGTHENFILKCQERLCGAAQLEVCLQTEATLDKYMDAVSAGSKTPNPYVYNALEPFSGRRTKCMFGYFKCDSPCPLGAQNAFSRLV